MFAVSSISKSSSSNQSTTPKNKRKSTRVQWACFSCRKRKQGCDSVRPCKRCVEKGIPCVEVESKRRRGRSKKEDASSKTHKHNEAGMEISSPPLQLEEEESSDSEDNSSFEDEADMTPPQKACKGSLPRNANSFSSTGHNHCHGNQSNEGGSLYAAASAPACLGSSSKLPKVDAKIVFQEQEVCMETISISMMESSSFETQQGFALNLALLSPYLEKFAESSETWLGNFIENQIEGLGPYHLNYSSTTHSSTLTKYEFLGNLISGDVIVDPFAPAASMTPESCSLEFCYKLLYQKLSQSEHNKKLYSNIKDKWKEILVSLKNLDWSKAQDLLSEIDFGYCFSSQKLFSKAPALVMWSPGGRIHLVNSAFCGLTGYSSEELKVSNGNSLESVKVNANMLFPSSEITKILQKQLEVIQTCESSVCSFLVKTRIITKNKQEVAVNCSINNLRDNFGSPILTTMFILC